MHNSFVLISACHRPSTVEVPGNESMNSPNPTVPLALNPLWLPLAWEMITQAVFSISKPFLMPFPPAGWGWAEEGESMEPRALCTCALGAVSLWESWPLGS